MLSSGQPLNGYMFITNLEKAGAELSNIAMENHSLQILFPITVTTHSSFQRADSVYACCPNININRSPLNLKSVPIGIKLVSDNGSS